MCQLGICILVDPSHGVGVTEFDFGLIKQSFDATRGTCFLRYLNADAGGSFLASEVAARKFFNFYSNRFEW
jgi:hypothetical protein